ncbi:hypothetical protein WH95_18570 [Kiloniella litopenaei]|uniref:Tail protein n=1 Tax=Kiloniella litopenaei TaxID=1549748 RepID=A0A0M2R1C2_9PROT|nr:phage tail tube protein [Kiloniella litopenaei]KKJ75446.1 hypothetical protein WH95_18570 [Kiloniella litopenaei]
MAKESGVKVILKVGDGADPEAFNDLSGQKDTRMSGAANAVDVSDKTTGGWGSTLPGTRNMTVTSSGFAVWPDTNGLQILRAHWEAGTNVNCELILNDSGNKYAGAFSITQLDIGGANDGATEYSVTLQNAGQPTYS